MADPRFFSRQGPYSLSSLAGIAGAELAPEADPDLQIDDVAPLSAAGPRQISFLDNKKYMDEFRASRAAACIVEPGIAKDAPAGMALLVSERPYRAYAYVAQAFYPDDNAVEDNRARAIVDSSAQIGEGVRIGACAVIGANTVIGDGAQIGPGAVVDKGVTIGASTKIGANATLSHCDLGARCLIHPGVRIGQRGFGFDMSAKGHVDVPQLGRVVVGDEVEIGANATIDRGSGPDTVIGDGTKIDNLVQIGHNVQIGRNCVVVAQAGVAGSATLQDFVVLAAQSGVAGHITVGAGTQLAARSGIMRDTEPGARLAGNPAIPAKEYFRQFALLAKLAKERDR